MPTFRRGRVAEVLVERVGLQRLAVDVDHDGGTQRERAVALTQLTGSVVVGDRVVLNTTAVELGLGTGGWHVVHWNLERTEWVEPGPGHLMKLRYTSLQADTGSAEEHHPEPSPDLAGMPVVACGLHSQVGVVAAAIAEARPGTRVVYVMTDGGALPLALSELVVALRERRLIVGTVTVGHAFGGDLEALSIPAGLALARGVLDAEIVVAGMGPGVAGTGTRLGTTAVEVAPLLDAAAALGGHPVACARVSDADPRPRHRGLSHHTRTALGLARSPVDVAVPLDAAWTVPGPHRAVAVDAGDPAALLERLALDVTTMGRGPADDPAFFAAAAAAGRVAAARVDGAPTTPR